VVLLPVGRRIDSQELAEEAVLVLRVVGRVPSAAPVSGCRVEVAVRAELRLAAVVVAEVGVGDLQHGALGRLVGHVRIAGALVLDDPDVAGVVG
jgi:hypothetical protein